MASTTPMKIHPLFVCMLLFFYVNGELALITVYFIALLIHELGHICIAKMLKIQIKSCTIYPYGGEIVLRNEHNQSYFSLMLIASGGLIATALCLLFTPILPEVLVGPFYKINLILLFLNVLPIWPLDGGRIILYFYLNKTRDFQFYSIWISWSLWIVSLLFIVVLVFWQLKAISILVILLYLWLAIWNEWRVRKYRIAFEKNKNISLT